MELEFLIIMKVFGTQEHNILKLIKKLVII